MMAVAKGLLLSEPTYDIIAPATNLIVPFAKLTFWLSRTSGGLQVPATVYQDGALQIPFLSNSVGADATGSFPAIYVNPSLPMRVQLFSPSGQLLQDVDPYVLNSRFIATASVAATESQTTNTTLTPDQYLSINIPYAGTYRYELQAEFVSANSGTNPNANIGMFLKGGGASTNLFNVLATNGGLLQDVATAVQIPGGVITAFASDSVVDPGSGTVYTPSAYSIGTSGYPIVLSGTAHTPAHITGMFTCTAPCVLTFAWSQNVSSAVALKLLQGSYLKVQNIQPTVQAGVSITTPLSSPDYSGLMTIAVLPFGAATLYGFETAGYAAASGASGGFGSIAPSADVLGVPVAALVSDINPGPTYGGITFALQGTLAQSYMASITTGGNTYPTASATNFQQFGGYTAWTWGIAFPAPSWSAGSGTVPITLP